MVVYIEVTKDKYELPVVVADSVNELARLCDTSVNNIYSRISHEEAGRYKSKYKKVYIDDEEEEINEQ